VLDKLPPNGDVGLVTHADDASQFQKQVIAMEQTDREVIGQEPFNDQKGPDLAFLRLPAESIGWLKAKLSFYNLTRRRDQVLSNKEPSRTYSDCVTGIIHELTQELPSEKPSVRRIQFSAIFCPVRLAALRYPTEFELFYFLTANEQDFPLPKSFQGTSGGAVWRFYLEERDGAATVIDRRLIAIPFFESLDVHGKRELTCHGPSGIYGGPIDRIIKRWPEAATARSPDPQSDSQG
jgi:hypothetical protein